MGKNSMRRDMSKIVLKDMFNLSDDEWTVLVCRAVSNSGVGSVDAGLIKRVVADLHTIKGQIYRRYDI